MKGIIFEVDEAPDGGYTARAVGVSIFAKGTDIDHLRSNIRDAINNHFEPDERPEFLELHIADHSLTEEQIAELERRIEDHRKNPNNSVSWETVRDEALKRSPKATDNKS